MYVGVILKLGKCLLTSRSIPHVCGGDPYHRRVADDEYVYSPCMWG